MKNKKDENIEMEVDVEKIKLVQSLREYHHKALWEEEKHFTWLLSIIFSAIVIILSTDKISLSDKAIIIIGVSFVGVILSLIALKVLRNESDNFQNALHNYIIEYNKYFPSNKQLEFASSSQNKSYFNLFLSGIRGKLTTRDAFQIVVLLFGTIFMLCTIGSIFIGFKYAW